MPDARYIRAFNRLEKAVLNHINDRCIDSDDLTHVHKSVMRDIGPLPKAQSEQEAPCNTSSSKPAT